MSFTTHPVVECKVRGLGDALAECLESRNIKKRPNCNCPKRQKDWNEFGDAHPTIAHFGVKLLNALKRK